MPRTDQTPAWQQLTELGRQSRGEPSLPVIEAAGLYADFSRQPVDAPVAAALVELAAQMQVAERRKQMYGGGLVNHSEQRPALHTALRAPGGGSAEPVVAVAIAEQLTRIRHFAEAIRGGKRRSITDRRFSDVVCIGIGGSLLGPQTVCAALARGADGPRLHFVSNVDGAHLEDTLRPLDPASTLFIVTSKTFTTDETMTNARTAQEWLAGKLGADANVRHFVAITAAPAEAQRQGYAEDATFLFWPWVGGRFSLWSAVGLPILLACGTGRFDELLAGAHAMDQHFLAAPPEQNLPLMLALCSVWHRNFLRMPAHAILPYAERLSLLPRHLQQVEMESTGKSIDIEGNPVAYATGPLVFGEAGTNGQHSFHQWLHQGTDPVPSDILLVGEPESSWDTHHEQLLAHGIAQADALWRGNRSEAGLAAHLQHRGGRPVTLLLLPRLDAWHLGALLALYEHKVFAQGVLWNINPFDQWGVELGKTMARSLLPVLATDGSAPRHLQSVIDRLRNAQARH